MSKIRKIELDEFIQAFDTLVEFHKNGDDPLPVIGDMKKLKSALDYPFQSVFGKALFPGFYNKAACYFYGFSKGHIFENGNKRCGVLSVNLFYKINRKKCPLDMGDMYSLAKYIANSDSAKKDKVIKTVAIILKTNYWE